MNIKKRLITWLTVSILTFSMACAAENDDTGVYMPDISDTEKTLEVTYTYAGTGISGAEISLYRIADITVKNGRADYSFTDEYAAYAEETDFETLTTEESIALAETIDITEKRKTAKAVTDENGMVTFTNLENGMYLAVQTGKSGAAEQYETFTSFLIAVPYASISEETEENGNRTGEWIDNVVCYPKTETAKIPTTPSTPKTGDNTAVGALFIIAAVSSGFLLFGRVKSRKLLKEGNRRAGREFVSQ